MNLLSRKGAHTKYRQYRRRFPLLKVFAYDNDGIWSADVADVDKLAR